MHRCSGMVKGNSIWIGESRCTAKASVKEDGEWYCKRHMPSKLKQKQALQRRESEQRIAKNRRLNNRLALYPELIKKLDLLMADEIVSDKELKDIEYLIKTAKENLEEDQK